MYLLETIRSSAKSDAIAANDKLLFLRPTDGGGLVPPLSGVCGEPESNIELAANLCFTEFGGRLANQMIPSPLHLEMTSNSKNTGIKDCARVPALLRAQLDGLFRSMTANWQRFSSALG